MSNSHRKLVSRLTRHLALALALGAAAGAQAQTTTTPAQAQADRVDNRQDRQDARIDQGVASGELTRRETVGVTRQQNHIERLENRTEADGQVTRREAVRMEKAQDRASKRVFRAKHDRQSRPVAP